MVKKDKMKQFIKRLFLEYNVELTFHPWALKDLKKHRNQLPLILELITRRAKQGALLKPDGLAESLNSPLHNCAKIKHKSSGIRIIYQPINKNVIQMKIIAIGPRDKMEAYKRAEDRV